MGKCHFLPSLILREVVLRRPSVDQRGFVFSWKLRNLVKVETFSSSSRFGVKNFVQSITLCVYQNLGALSKQSFCGFLLRSQLSYLRSFSATTTSASGPCDGSRGATVLKYQSAFCFVAPQPFTGTHLAKSSKFAAPPLLLAFVPPHWFSVCLCASKVDPYQAHSGHNQ